MYHTPGSIHTSPGAELSYLISDIKKDPTIFSGCSNVMGNTVLKCCLGNSFAEITFLVAKKLKILSTSRKENSMII